MHIVHLSSSISVESGGVSRAVIDSAFALSNAGVRVTLLSFEGGTLDLPWGDTPPKGLEIVLCKASGKRFGSSEFRNELERRLPTADILHLHGLWEPITALAAKRARYHNVSYVCSIHGMLDPWSLSQRPLRKKWYYRLVERKRFARAAAVHFTAQQEKTKAAAWIPEGPQQIVIPVLLNLEAYRDLPQREVARSLFPSIPSEVPWILFLSRIHEKKGLDLLIRAFALLERTDLQLVIAGSGDRPYLEVLRELATTLKVASRVHFVGSVGGSKKVALYRGADMLAIPTSQENFGLVFPEAMACETPVLLTKDVDIYEPIVNAEAGILIRRDPQDIAHHIGLLLASPIDARRRGILGRQWVLNTLEPSHVIQQWIESYQSIATKKAPVLQISI